MTDNNSTPVQPQTPVGNPPAAPDNWIMMSLNRIDQSISCIQTDLRDVDRKMDTVDRKADAASHAIAGLPDLASHIKDTSVFIGKTDVRLEQLSKSSVTKGQIAIWTLLTVLAALGAIGAAGWWVIEKYLIPILERLPPA